MSVVAVTGQATSMHEDSDASHVSVQVSGSWLAGNGSKQTFYVRQYAVQMLSKNGLTRQGGVSEV